MSIENMTDSDTTTSDCSPMPESISLYVYSIKKYVLCSISVTIQKKHVGFSGWSYSLVGDEVIVCHLSLFICLSHSRLGRLSPQMNALSTVSPGSLYILLYTKVSLVGVRALQEARLVCLVTCEEADPVETML